MTILSKDTADSSSAPGPFVQGSDPKLGEASRHEVDEEAIGSPPSYVDSQPAGPSTIRSPEQPASIPLPRPTNFMIVNRPFGNIEGTWVIDTSVQIPEALLPPLGMFASLPNRPNLGLHAANGSIMGSVFLASSSSDRAVIRADTKWRKVALSVARISGSNQPFKLSVNTTHGDMIIGLPRDYVGPLRYKAGWSKTTFSTALRAMVVEISDESGFVGDLGQSGFVDYGTWSKDEVDVENTWGAVSFMYVDEIHAPNPPRGRKQRMGVARKALELFLSRPRRRSRIG